jgi:di/tricarboxylate transporter
MAIPASAILAAIMAAAFVLMLSNRVRPDVVAVGMALALGLSGVIRLDDVFAGFSRPAVITIIAIFVIAQGVQRTGVTRSIGRAITRLSGGERAGEARMTLVVMLCGAVLSLFMNNIAAAAIALPATVDALKRRRVAPSKVLMPLAFATALGGMATYLTTGNIVVSEALIGNGLPGYGLLDFVMIGGPVALIGMLFLLTIGRKLLPARSAFAELGASTELQDTYALGERVNYARVPPTSPLAGLALARSGIGSEFGLSLMALQRGAQTLLAPAPSEVLQAGDVLVLIGREERAGEFARSTALALMTPPPNANNAWVSDDVPLVEVMLAPRSRAAGQTLAELHFRERYGANVLAVWHGARSVRTDLARIQLQHGDALLVQATRAALALLQSDSDFLVLRAPEHEAQPRRGRAVVAALLLLATLTVSAVGWLPIAHAMMIGALAMVLTGCLSMDEAYRAVDWRAVFLVAGMLPVSIAMIRTGAADALAARLIALLAPFGAYAVGGGLLLLTVALTQFMSGQVTGVVLAPVAISAALALGADPRAMAMMVALGTSLTFITPTAHPVNVFVMGAGGYHAGDYPRIGVPLTIVLMAAVLLMAPLVWPLQ